MNVSRLLYRFKSYHFTENEHLKYLTSQLKILYEDTSGISKKRKNFEQEERLNKKYGSIVIENIKDIYKNNSAISSPWIDNTLWNQINSVDQVDLPKDISSDDVIFTRGNKTTERTHKRSSLFNMEVRSKDFECIQRYITSSRVLSSSKIDSFGRAGIKAAIQLNILNKNKIVKRSIDNSVLETAKNTNSGWPFFKRKNTKLCIDDTRNWMKCFLDYPSYYSLLKNPCFDNYTSLFHRIQPSMENDSCKVKVRQVWCVPQRIVCLEHYFFSGILKNVCNNNKYSRNPIYSSGLTNFEISTSIVSRLRNSMNPSSRNKLFSLDYSKYDSTIPNFGIDLFFAIVKEQLVLNKKEEKAFERLRCYTRNTPLCYGNNIYIKTKGIMSGSYITNLFDTWFNLLLFNLSESTSKRKPDYKQHDDFMEYIIFEESDFNTFRHCLGICGDDIIIYTNDYEICIHKNICLSLGMKIEVNSSYIDPNEDIFFLGRYWDKENRPIQTFKYMVSHICLRTRFYSLKDVNQDIIKNLDLYRILSICLQFYNGVKFLNKYFRNWDPYKSFINSNKDYTLLKEWPNENYRVINRIDAFDWRSY